MSLLHNHPKMSHWTLERRKLRALPVWTFGGVVRCCESQWDGLLYCWALEGTPKHTTSGVSKADNGLPTFSSPPHPTTAYYTTLCYTTLCYATQCYATLCYSTLCYATLSYATLCYATLHYTTQNSQCKSFTSWFWPPDIEYITGCVKGNIINTLHDGYI